jgi:hypothetical protein
MREHPAPRATASVMQQPPAQALAVKSRRYGHVLDK